MGLYDGYNGISDAGSTSEMAKTLKSPVILVMNGSNFSRSAGALALGHKNFGNKLICEV